MTDFIIEETFIEGDYMILIAKFELSDINVPRRFW